MSETKDPPAQQVETKEETKQETKEVAGGEGSAAGNEEVEDGVSSDRVEPRLFKVFTEENEANSNSVQITLPDGYKVLAGGVRVFGQGAAVTSCYPASQFSWRATVLKISQAAVMKLTVVALYDPNDEYKLDIFSSNDPAAASTHYASSPRTPSNNHTVAAPSPLHGHHGVAPLSLGTSGMLTYPACEIPLTMNGETLVGGGAESTAPLIANLGLPDKSCWIAEAMDQAPVTVYALSLYRRQKSNQQAQQAEGDGANRSDATADTTATDENIYCTMDIKGRWGLTFPGVPGGEMRFSFGSSCDKNVLALAYLRTITADSNVLNTTHHQHSPGGVVQNLDKVPTLQWQGKRQIMSDLELHDAATQFCHSTKVRAPPPISNVGSFVTSPTTPTRPSQLKKKSKTPQTATRGGGATTPRGTTTGTTTAGASERRSSMKKGPVPTGSFASPASATMASRKTSFR